MSPVVRWERQRKAEVLHRLRYRRVEIATCILGCLAIAAAVAAALLGGVVMDIHSLRRILSDGRWTEQGIGLFVFYVVRELAGICPYEALP